MASVIKEMMLQEIKGEFQKNPYAFISDSTGLNVADVSKFRRDLEGVSTRSLMVKQTLAQRVFKEMNFDGADHLLDGAVLVTFGEREPQAISKAIVEYAKSNQNLKPSGVIFESKVYDKQFVEQLAALPSREELLTQMLVRMKSPINGFVNGLGQLIRGLVTAINEVKKQKEAGTATA